MQREKCKFLLPSPLTMKNKYGIMESSEKSDEGKKICSFRPRDLPVWCEAKCGLQMHNSARSLKNRIKLRYKIRVVPRDGLALSPL
jgi:hypothetical protein